MSFVIFSEVYSLDGSTFHDLDSVGLGNGFGDKEYIYSGTRRPEAMKTRNSVTLWAGTITHEPLFKIPPTF
jgi:hypothetical protein